jgi:uncharacterized protein (TIGR03437 family)
VSFSVAANPSPEARSGQIRAGDQTFTVVQTGRNCTFAVTPEALSIPGRGGRATATVAGDKGCRWEPSKDQAWLSIDSWSSIDGTGSVTVSAKANPEPRPRTATLVVGGRAVAVTQGGREVILDSAGSVLNAASFEAGPIAPGEIVTIFGAGIGPLTPAEFELSADRRHITSTLAGVQVLFDGIAAPLIYVSEKQVSVQVPYRVAGLPSTELRVVNQGVESNTLTLQVTEASPAIFTVDGSGIGQGAILNQDGSLNGAANAAARNSILQIFATGEGQTQPAGEDGKIAGEAPLPAPELPVRVLIGGQTAAVTYAGAAPGAIAGLFQVNARVPQNVAAGRAVPVVVRVGSGSSPAGVTVAIREGR